MQYPNRFVIRLDIDTIACVKALPKILSIADELHLQLSLYVNMGRSVSLRGALSRRLHGKRYSIAGGSGESNSKKLPIIKKIGFSSLIETVIFNPSLFPMAKADLYAAREAGHEIGLHGGINHGLWQTYANQMSNSRIKELLYPALDQFVNHFGTQFGFTSPGFVVNDFSYTLLSEYGCNYVSDHVNPSGCTSTTNVASLRDIPVTLSGPGNVDFLEWYMATRSTDSMDAVADRFFGVNGFGVYYTHPCFAAGVGSDVFRRLINSLRERGVSVKMRDIASMI